MRIGKVSDTTLDRSLTKEEKLTFAVEILKKIANSELDDVQKQYDCPADKAFQMIAYSGLCELLNVPFGTKI